MTTPTTAPGRVGEIRFLAESSPIATISGASVYWSSSFDHLRVWDADPSQLKYDSEEDPSLTLNAFEQRPKLLTAKSGGLPFKCHLTGLAQTAADTTAITREDLGLLLVSALGGESLGTTRKVTTANGAKGATSPLLMSSTAGLATGQAACINGECRRITALSANVSITLDMDLTTAPALNDLVIASATYYISEAALVDLANAGHLTLAALFRGYHAEDQYQVRGCFPEITAFENLTPQKIANIAVMLHACAWELVTNVTADSSWTAPIPPAQIYSGLYCQAQGTVTATAGPRHAKNVSIGTGLKPKAQESAIGEQGLVGHFVESQPPPLEFDTFYDSEWNIAYEARTKFYAGYQIGRPTSTTGCVFISWPQLTLDETPAVQHPKDNTTMAKVKMHGDQYLAGATDLSKSRMSIHVFPHT